MKLTYMVIHDPLVKSPACFTSDRLSLEGKTTMWKRLTLEIKSVEIQA